MTINLSDNSPRISYTVAQGATQSAFVVPFEFFADADLNVYVDGTQKTLENLPAILSRYGLKDPPVPSFNYEDELDQN